jgi:hypothetical protein
VHFRRLVEGNVYRIPDQIDDAHPTLVWLLGETDVLALPPRCLVYPTVEKQSFTYLIHTPTAPTFLTELQTAFPTGRLSGTITSPLTGQTLYEEFTMTTGESTSHRLPIRFGDVIELVANPLISMTETAVRVVPTWQAAAQPEADYTLFVHLYPAGEEDNPPLIQLDKQPCLPTSQWRPGELIQERYSLPLPRDRPSGNYALVLGWYTWPTLERLLPDSGAVLEGDRLLLAELSFPDSVRSPP